MCAPESELGGIPFCPHFPFSHLLLHPFLLPHIHALLPRISPSAPSDHLPSHAPLCSSYFPVPSPLPLGLPCLFLAVTTSKQSHSPPLLIPYYDLSPPRKAVRVMWRKEGKYTDLQRILFDPAVQCGALCKIIGHPTKNWA